MLLRQAESTDAAILARIAADAWASHIFQYEKEKPDQRQNAELAFFRFVQEHMRQILVVESNAMICGWGARDSNENYISDIWVDPAFHGRGIGTKLMDGLLAQIVLLGYKTAEIGTHARNLPAIGLYKKCGFAVVEHFDEWSDSLARVVEKVKMRAAL